jgi:hypothetical protein
VIAHGLQFVRENQQILVASAEYRRALAGTLTTTRAIR